MLRCPQKSSFFSDQRFLRHISGPLTESEAQTLEAPNGNSNHQPQFFQIGAKQDTPCKMQESHKYLSCEAGRVAVAFSATM